MKHLKNFFDTQGAAEIATCTLCFLVCALFKEWAVALFFLLMGFLGLFLFILSKRGSK